MPDLPQLKHLHFVLFLCVLAVGAPLSAQEGENPGRRLHWRELAVQAHLDADGDLHVRERQAMVFDGAWNGGERVFDLRLGQELDIRAVTRIDPETGARTPLRAGGLEALDEYDMVDGSTLRWRSRLPSDPPFVNEEIIYEIDYTLGPVVFPDEEGAYLLRHDFAFADRAGVIERFAAELTMDWAWETPAGAPVRASAEMLPPGRGYTLSVPLQYVGAGQPSRVATGTPGWVRAIALLGALIIPLLTLRTLRRRDRELDAIAPITPPTEIDEPWLREHIFAYPAEVVGTSWDRRVGEAEVAALLARLVEEGKLASRVEPGGDKPVLHLRRIAPLSQFPPHERDLLEALFFDGSDQTDTARIREHYKKEGFDPAAKIRSELTARLDLLPGPGHLKRSWLPGVGILLLGIVLAMSEAGRPGGPLVGFLGLAAAATLGIAALSSAMTVARRVTHRTLPTFGVVVSLSAGALLLALLASGVFEGENGLLFYRPGPPFLLGHLTILAALGMLASVLSRPTETPERLGFRRRLVSARQFFEAELAKPLPRLKDTWFPYLLAFGLGPEMDRWFRDFGGTSNTTASAGGVLVATSGAGGAGGSAGGGWSGGGAQFGGGGGFGGGGAAGSWSAAAAGMAAGVPSPSSSSAGAASGGGGGGGW